MLIKWRKASQVFVAVKAKKTVYKESVMDLDDPNFKYRDIQDKATFIGRGFKCRVTDFIYQGDYGLVEVLLDDQD
jgi:hypothetical protein